LPELPADEPAPFNRRSSVASTRSAASGTPSLTPSLRQYVDGGSFEQDKVEIGVARTVQMSPTVCGSRLQSSEEAKLEQLANCSISDYETSPLSTNDSNSQINSSPSRYLPTTSSMLEAHYSIFSPKREMATSRKPESANDISPRHARENGLSRISSMQLSESEWISRTPSPARGGKSRV